MENIIERLESETEFEIWFTAVESDGDRDSPGDWKMHTPVIKLSIVLKDGYDERLLILDKLRSGDFSVDLRGADFCNELVDYKDLLILKILKINNAINSLRKKYLRKKILGKDNIVCKATEAIDLDKFIKDIQSEVYYATLDWYIHNYNAVLVDALYDLTEMGGKGIVYISEGKEIKKPLK
jgi:hypothetical protein